MIKIIIGKNLEQGSGRCDFCGVEVEDGVYSNKISQLCTHLKNEFDCKWLAERCGHDFWGNPKYGEEKLIWIPKNKMLYYETKDFSFRSVICKDCIKQLAKQI